MPLFHWQRSKELLDEGVSGVEGHLLARPAEACVSVLCTTPMHTFAINLQCTLSFKWGVTDTATSTLHFTLELSVCATCPQLESDTIAHVSTIAASAMCPILVASVSSRVAANAVSAARFAGPAGRVVFGEVALAPLVQDFGSLFQDAEHSKEAALALTAPPMRPDPSAPDYLLKLVTRSFFPLTLLSPECTVCSTLVEFRGSEPRELPVLGNWTIC